MSINHVNAGIIHTQARLAGLDLDGALARARAGRLHGDLNATPHRPTVVRLLKALWEREAAEAARQAELARERTDRDAAVAAAFPAEWAAAAAQAGRTRRAAKRALRRRFDAARDQPGKGFVIRLKNGNLWKPLGASGPAIFASRANAETTVAGFSGRGALAEPTVMKVVGAATDGARLIDGYYVIEA
jgi:hypothetical protein